MVSNKGVPMSTPNPNGSHPDVSSPVVPISTPHQTSFGHPYSQVEQRLNDLLFRMGELTTKVDTLTKTVDSTKSKVEDIVAWRNRILGGVIVVGVLASLVTVVVTKFADWISIKPPTALSSQSADRGPAEPPAL